MWIVIYHVFAMTSVTHYLRRESQACDGEEPAMNDDCGDSSRYEGMAALEASVIDTLNRFDKLGSRMDSLLSEASQVATKEEDVTALQADFDAYEVRAKASMPPCSSYMKDISRFVKKYAGGGEGGELLTELNNFTKAFAFGADGPLRRLGGELLHKVVSLQWPKNKVYPRVINALLMTNLSSSKTMDGICRLLTPASLSELTGKSIEAKIQKAEDVMERAREVCERLGLEAHHKTRVLGQLDVRCITHIKKLEKEHENIKFQTLDAISEAHTIFE